MPKFCGESSFPGSSQISFSFNITCVFPNPATYFGQTPVRLNYHCSGNEPALVSPPPPPPPPPQKKNTAVCSFWGPRERRKSSLHNGRPCYRGKNKYYSFSLQRSSWLVNWPLQTESNLTLPNSAFSSSWLQRQLAVRPPIIIGMVRHVPLAPSVGQGTEWKQNVAKSKTQSVKSVCLDTIGRITRAWNRVWSKLNCTQ